MRSLEKIKSYPPPCTKLHVQRSSFAVKSWRLSGENSSLLANEAPADDNVENKTKKGQPPLPEAGRQHSDSVASDPGLKISQAGRVTGKLQFLVQGCTLHTIFGARCKTDPSMDWCGNQSYVGGKYRVLSYSLAGSINLQPNWKTMWESLPELNMCVFYDPAIPLPGICL